MRLPNGYGTVYKLSGNRRKPWIARKSKVMDDPEQEKGLQKWDTIGTYETKKDALQALARYNEDPYDLHADSITFSELYDKWSKVHFVTIVPSAIRTWKSAYSYCTPLYKMKMKEIRTIHLEETIKSAKVGDATKGRMKSMFNLMYRYAKKHDIVDKDYAELCDVIKADSPKRKNTPFSSDEIKKLWESISFPFADMVMVGIYSGWRPQELAILKSVDIDLKNNTMFGGIKTDAGRNRYVPIHPLIRPLIEARYNINNEYLFNDDNGQQGTYMTYDKYRKRFDKVMLMLGIDHHPHETRHTFITKAKECKMDEYILKLIVGHAINDITEKIYTHRTMEQLQEEIIKIK